MVLLTVTYERTFAATPGVGEHIRCTTLHARRCKRRSSRSVPTQHVSGLLRMLWREAYRVDPVLAALAPSATYHPPHSVKSSADVRVWFTKA